MRSTLFLIGLLGCASSSGSEGGDPPPPPPKQSKKPPRRPGQPRGQAELEAAVNAAKSDDLDGAIEQCKAAIKKNPQLEHAYLLYGSSCAMKGDETCESSAYAAGLEALPRSVGLKKAMALIHLGKADYETAIAMLKEANELSGGKDAELLADLAYAHIFVQKLDEGEALARQSLKINPECFQCAMALGELSLVGKKFGQAAEAYGTASGLQPDEPGPRQKLARATYLSGDKKAGVQKYEAEIEKSPDDAAFRFEFAKVLLDAGRAKDAVKHIEKLLEASPDEPNLLKILLKAQTKAKNKKGAAATKKRLKRLGVKP